MKANELRLGNYFIGYSNYLQQWELVSFKLLAEGIEVDEIIRSYIPLDEEWLLKLGFLKYKGDNKDFWLNDFEFANDLKWIFWRGNILENIKYVHQLQNLYFALTGDELTVA